MAISLNLCISSLTKELETATFYEEKVLHLLCFIREFLASDKRQK